MARAARWSESGRRDGRSKLAEHRLSVLELARELGNVAEACRHQPETSVCFDISGSRSTAPFRAPTRAWAHPPQRTCVEAATDEHPTAGADISTALRSACATVGVTTA